MLTIKVPSPLQTKHAYYGEKKIDKNLISETNPEGEYRIIITPAGANLFPVFYYQKQQGYINIRGISHIYTPDCGCSLEEFVSIMDKSQIDRKLKYIAY